MNCLSDTCSSQMQPGLEDSLSDAIWAQQGSLVEGLADGCMAGGSQMFHGQPGNMSRVYTASLYTSPQGCYLFRPFGRSQLVAIKKGNAASYYMRSWCHNLKLQIPLAGHSLDMCADVL